MVSIFEKYAPKSIDDLFLSKNYKETLKKWVENPEKPLLIWGKRGVGKTTVAKLLVEKYLGGKPIVIDPSNASMVERGIPKRDLFGRRIIPIVENLDEFPQSDQMKVVTSLMKQHKVFIITAIDFYSINGYYRLKDKVVLFNVYPPNPFFLKRLVYRVLKDHNLKAPGWLVESLVKDRFDIKSLLVDLQTFIDLNGDVEAFKRIYSARNYSMNVFEVLQDIFTNQRPQLTVMKLSELTIPFEEFLMHLAENIARSEGDWEDKISALNSVSLAQYYNDRSALNGYATYGSARVFASTLVSNFYAQGKLKPPKKLDISRFPIKYRMTKNRRGAIDRIFEKLRARHYASKDKALDTIAVIRANLGDDEFVKRLKQEFFFTDEDIEIIRELKV